MASCKKEASDLRKREDEQLKTLRSLEEGQRKMETLRLREQTEMESRSRESERLAADRLRELELLRRSGRQLKLQLQQMQELLAVREREHLTAMEGRKPLDSKEVGGGMLCGFSHRYYTTDLEAKYGSISCGPFTPIKL